MKIKYDNMVVYKGVGIFPNVEISDLIIKNKSYNYIGDVINIVDSTKLNETIILFTFRDGKLFGIKHETVKNNVTITARLTFEMVKNPTVAKYSLTKFNSNSLIEEKILTKDVLIHSISIDNF